MKMKRGLGFALGVGALFGALTFAGGSAYAEGCVPADSFEVEGYVRNESELQKAIQEEVASVKVGNDFTISCSPSYISNDFVLDLNGNKVTAEVSWALDIETEGKTLTIDDTSETGAGEYVTNGKGIWVDAGAKAVLRGGKISNTTGQGRAFVAVNGSSLSVEGGEIEAVNEAYYAPIIVSGDNVTMNMSGGTVRTGEFGILATGATVNMTGGSIVSTGTERSTGVSIDDGAVFTMTGGSIDSDIWGMVVFNDSEFIMNGGTINAGEMGVAGNGTNNPESGNYGANAKITINGGTITSNDLGVYAPQVDGLTTIGEGATINAKKAGVEIRAGELVVNGATINVDENAEYAFNPNGSGSTASGVGIAVAQHTTKQAITATVNSAVVTAPVAFAEGNPQHNPDEDIARVSLLIKDGTFTATNGEPIVASEDVEGFVEGGFYSKEIEEKYIKEGYDLFEAGDDFVVNKMDVVGLPEMTLLVGETRSLATDFENYSNTSVAVDDTGDLSVSGMVLTAVKSGAATYTVTYGNGIYRKTTSEYRASVIDLEKDLMIEADEELGFSAEEISEIQEKVTEMIENGQYVSEDGAVSVVDIEALRGAIANGETIRIEKVVDEIDPAGLDEEGLEQLAQIIGENDTPVSILSIEYAMFGGNDQVLGRVNKLANPVTIEFVVPEGMREAAEGFTRKFTVVRFHSAGVEEQITRLAAEFDGEKASVENDLFSVFILTYQDKERETQLTAPQSPNLMDRGHDRPCAWLSP